MIKITDTLYIEATDTSWKLLLKTDLNYALLEEKEKLQDIYEAAIEKHLRQWDQATNKIKTPDDVQDAKDELLYVLSKDFRKFKDEQKAREQQESDNAKVIEAIRAKKGGRQ